MGYKKNLDTAEEIMKWGTGQNKQSEMRDKKYGEGVKKHRGYREKVLSS